MAELNICELFGSFNQIVFMTETVSKNDVAALVNQVSSSLIALIAFRDVGLEKILNACCFTSGLSTVDEVKVIS